MSKLRCSESRQAKFAKEKVKNYRLGILIIKLTLILGKMKLDVCKTFDPALD